MARYCDLHTHSYYSDGTFSPEQLLRAAEAEDLTAVALCDHNTVDGLPEFLAAGETSPVEAVAGVEFSTDHQDTELHILALFVEPRHFASITALLEEARQRKEQSNIDLVDALARAGLDMDYTSIKASTRNGFVNRANIAAELTRKGYADSIQAAFKKYLSPRAGFYTPPKRMDAFEAIRYIKSLGAVAVLAHPFLNLSEEPLRLFLKKAADCGLDAMETLYPKYDPLTTSLAGRMADEFGLLPSGGSDFHGANKPDIRLGTGRGDLRVPDSFFQSLKQRKG